MEAKSGKSRTGHKNYATEMDFWHLAAGKSRMERVTNARIREIMDAPHTITDEIRTKQLIWYGHVQRMGDERLPKQVLKWKPLGKRKRGKPRKSWIEGVNSEMQERGLEQDQWMDWEG